MCIMHLSNFNFHPFLSSSLLLSFLPYKAHCAFLPYYVCDPLSFTTFDWTSVEGDYLLELRQLINSSATKENGIPIYVSPFKIQETS